MSSQGYFKDETERGYTDIANYYPDCLETRNVFLRQRITLKWFMMIGFVTASMEALDRVETAGHKMRDAGADLRKDVDEYLKDILGIAGLFQAVWSL